MNVKEYLKESARQEARQEWWQKGQQQGMQQGMEKGMEAVAFNMLKKQLDFSLIAEVTGLSQEKTKKRFLSTVLQFE